MIGKVLARGSSVRGLLYYLFTEGLAGERGLEAPHSDARLIASWDGGSDDGDTGLSGWQPPATADGHRDVRALAAALDVPVAALGLDPMPRSLS